MLLSIRQSIAAAICPELFVERRNLERAANVDALTGLANRRAFDLALPAAELDPATSIILFDVNNFGKLNKNAGHRFGDMQLKEIAAAIADAARAYGIANRAFRIGGDEFAVLAPAGFAAIVRDAVERRVGVRYPGIQVSISGTIGATFDAADAAIQERKRNKKNETTKFPQ